MGVGLEVGLEVCSSVFELCSAVLFSLDRRPAPLASWFGAGVRVAQRRTDVEGEVVDDSQRGDDDVLDGVRDATCAKKDEAETGEGGTGGEEGGGGCMSVPVKGTEVAPTR